MVVPRLQLHVFGSNSYALLLSRLLLLSPLSHQLSPPLVVQ